jgi:cyanophycinase
MGKIILIGGNVDKGGYQSKKNGGKPSGLKSIHPEILIRLISELKGEANGRIEIITAATDLPKEVGEEYCKALTRLGCNNLGNMYFDKPEKADKVEFLERLKKCDGLIFTGGDQIKLCMALKDSEFLEYIKARYRRDENFLVAGTSAGAMALTEVMIAGGTNKEALSKGHVHIGPGLGLLPGIIVDTHFIKRGRFSRLIEAVSCYPAKLGVGLGENTAVFFSKPQNVTTIGSNLVVLFDATDLTFNNIQHIKNDELICLENLKMHILPKERTFNIPQRKIYKKKSLSKKTTLVKN